MDIINYCINKVDAKFTICKPFEGQFYQSWLVILVNLLLASSGTRVSVTDYVKQADLWTRLLGDCFVLFDIVFVAPLLVLAVWNIQE